MINEEVLPNFGISPEIINKITWSKPVLNFGLPDKRVKELNDKITKKRNLPQGSFGSISTIIHSTVSSNTVAFNENLSTGICKVFWNKETNEVLKLLDKKIYAHYDAINNMPLPSSQITIDEDILKRCDVDLSTIDLDTSFEFPQVLNHYDKSIDSDVYEYDDYNEYLEQMINCKLDPCPAIPQSRYTVQSANDNIISTEMQSSTDSEQTSDDADISDFSENENDEIISPITVTLEKRTNDTATIPEVHANPVPKNPLVQSIIPTQSFRHNINPSFQNYSISKRQGLSDLKYQIASLKIELNNKINLINQMKLENDNLKTIVASKQNVLEKNARLEKELSDAHKIKHEQERIILEMQEKNEFLIQKQTEFINRINDLVHNKQITKENVIKYFDSTKPEYVSDLGWKIQREMFRNSHVPKEKHSYSENTKKFCWIINSQCPSAYETVRTTLPLPCYNTINTALRKTVMQTECSLLDLKYVSKLSDTFLSKYTESTIKATLAVDALVVALSTLEILKKQYASESPSLVRAYNTQVVFKDMVKGVFNDQPCTEKEKSELEEQKESDDKHDDAMKEQEKPLNNVFVFYVEPINPEIPCYPVHVYLQSGGSANEVVRTITEHVVAQVQQSGKCIITDISTDGDTGHQEEYQRALLALLSVSPELDIDVLVDALGKFKFPTLAAADMLHFLKTMRTRTLLNMLTLFPDHLSVLFSFADLGSIFGNGHEINDVSQLGKMRDVYPVLFYSLKNLNILIKDNMLSAVVMFMPWSLWITATMNTGLTVEARIFLLKVCYEFVRRYYNIMSSNKKWEKDVGSINRNKAFLTIQSKSVLERLIPTLVVIISELENFKRVDDAFNDWKIKEDNLKKAKDVYEINACKTECENAKRNFNEIAKYYGYPENMKPDFAFDRIGTHPLENFNGNIRDTAHSNDTLSSTSHIVAKAHVQKLLKNELGIPNVRKKRINAGGIRLSESKNCIGMPKTTINPSVLVDSIFALAEAGTEETILNFVFSDEAINEFFNYLKECETISDAKNCNPKFNVPIAARNSGINTRNIMYSAKNDEE